MIASVNVTVIATVGLRLLHAALHEVQLTHKPMFTGILARRTKAQNLIRPIAVYGCVCLYGNSRVAESMSKTELEYNFYPFSVKALHNIRFLYNIRFLIADLLSRCS